MMPKHSNEIPKHIEILWQDAVSNIQIAKQQEWKITNYVLIVMGAIFILDGSIQGPLGVKKMMLSLLTILAVIFGYIFLAKMKLFADKMRARLSVIYQTHFSLTEKELYRVDPNWSESYVGVLSEIGKTLLVIILIAALINFAAIWDWFTFIERKT